MYQGLQAFSESSIMLINCKLNSVLNSYLRCDFVQSVPSIGSPRIRYIEQPDPLVIVALHSTTQTAVPLEQVRHLFDRMFRKARKGLRKARHYLLGQSLTSGFHDFQ